MKFLDDLHLLEAELEKFDLIKLKDGVDVEVLIQIIKDGGYVLRFNDLPMSHILGHIKANFKAQAMGYSNPSNKFPLSLAGAPRTVFTVYHIKDKTFYSRCIWDIKLKRAGKGHDQEFTYGASFCLKLIPKEAGAYICSSIEVPEGHSFTKFDTNSGDAIDIRKVLKGIGNNGTQVLMISGTQD